MFEMAEVQYNDNVQCLLESHARGILNRGCRQAIENWCRRCNLCASRKGPHKRKHGPAQIYLNGVPMERVAIDILGPLPETEQGNRYLLVGEVHMEVRRTFGHSAARMRTYYDRKADDEVYQPGDVVWYYYPWVKKGFSPKLMRPWTGPYKVMSRIHDNTYRIQLSSRTRPRVVNRYHLWRCRGRLAEGWWGQSSSRGDEPDMPAEDAPESFDKDLGETIGDGERPLQSTRRGRPIKRPQRYR